jgi:hypothetical protein
MSSRNIIEQYYQGISQQLHAEVHFINTLFQHQGLKGTGNETILRELLIRFIPKRYGVGTGVVIDRSGHQSKQCDIVIYDILQYPSLLNLTPVHLFPIDIVYATIEVKTTLSSEEASNAVANIRSVKELRRLDFTPERDEPQALYSPLGFVFAYKSDVEQFAAFKNWFTPPSWEQPEHYPTIVGCLDQGILKFSEKVLEGQAFPKLQEVPLGDHMGMIRPALSDELSGYEKDFYPPKRVKVKANGTSQQLEKTVHIDQSKVLLYFILSLNDFLSRRRIHPNISFLEDYLPFITKFSLAQ